MNKTEVLNKVHIKTFYIGESKKADNPNIALIQTSADNTDILNDYFSRYMNELAGYMNKRLIDFSWDGETLSVQSSREKKDEMIQVLDNAISDYLAERMVFQWLLDNNVEVNNPPLYEELLDKVKTYIAALSPNVRRRATTMGV